MEITTKIYARTCGGGHLEDVCDEDTCDICGEEHTGVHCPPTIPFCDTCQKQHDINQCTLCFVCKGEGHTNGECVLDTEPNPSTDITIDSLVYSAQTLIFNPINWTVFTPWSKDTSDPSWFFNKIALCQEDITNISIDIVVNSAKESLVRGSGVDDAIHQRAGPKLQQACTKVARARREKQESRSHSASLPKPLFTLLAQETDSPQC